MKDFAFCFFTLLIRTLLRLLPHKKIVNTQIMFSSYLGKQYSCNPKYISEYIMHNAPEYTLIWAFKNPNEYHYLTKKGIQLVTYNSFKFIKLCLSSKYIITNVRDMTYIPFSKKQQIINTWHGGGAYKCVGSSKATLSKSENHRQRIATKNPTIYLSSSKIFSELTLKRSFNHTGIILNTGMPRNDLLIKENKPELKAKIYEYYNIPSQNKLVIYAPTYREGKKAADYSFETEAVCSALSARFKGEWTVIFRMHYYIAEELSANNPNYINASNYPDMQELLYVSDVLITDYSSSIWDFSFTKRPCFLYATDLSKYDMTQGFYTDINTWPFSLAQNTRELLENIKKYDKNNYSIQIDKHHLNFGSYETGNASRKVFEYIKSQTL